MDMKSIIQKLKTFLQEEISLMDVKTSDGTILNFEKMEVDVPIFVVDETGTNPAPDGTYILEDGTSIEVVGGLISVINLPTEPVEVETPEVEVEIPVETMKDERLEKLEAELKSLKEMMLQIAESLSKDNLKQELKAEKPEIKQEYKKVNVQYKNTELNNILKNMYKKYVQKNDHFFIQNIDQLFIKIFT